MGAARPLALVGPTASGKTEAAVLIAERLGAEIVSVDSMLVYRGMDIGTDKPTMSDRARVRHHLLDAAEPEEPFSVSRYQELARDALSGIRARGRRALLCGGSGLYFRAVVDGLDFPATDRSTRDKLEAEAAAVGPEPLYERLVDVDPASAGRIEPADVRRTVRALEVAAVTGRPFSSYAREWERYPEHAVRAAGVEIVRDVLVRRIAARVEAMVAAGFLDEVGALVERGFGGWLTASQAIGYAEMTRHLRAEISLDEAVQRTVKRTKALARRQLAWFRRDPRIRWFGAGEEGAAGIVNDLMEYLSGG